MASNTVFKTARNSGFHDNDPLAELTRIMGLQEEERADDNDDIDFGIDLEKELLGDLHRDDEPVAAAPANEAYSDPDFDAAFSELFEEHSIDAGEADMVAAPEAIASAYVPPEDILPVAQPDTNVALDDHDFEVLKDAVDAMEFEPELPDQSVQAVAAAGASAPALSLEDELSALLGVPSPATAAAHDELSVEAETEVAAEDDADWSPRDDDEWAVDAVAGADWNVAAEPASDSHAEAVLDGDDFAPEFEIADDLNEDASPDVQAFEGDAVEFEAADDFVALSAHSQSAFPAGEPAEDDESDLDAAIAGLVDDGEWTVEDAPAAAVSVADEPIYDQNDFDSVEEFALEDVQVEASDDADWQVEPEVGAAFETEPADVEVFEPEPVQSLIEDEPVALPPAAAPVDLDGDPFAALAALAAAPPLVKPFSRTNPVAMQPASERVSARPSPLSDPSANPARQPYTFERREPSFAAPAAPVAAPAAAAAPAPYTPRPFTPPMAAAPVAAAAAASTYVPRAYQPEAVPEPVAEEIDEEFLTADDEGDVPDIDTIDISDDMAALADELDIPELAEEEPAPRAVDFDDLDSEFASAFNQLNTPVEDLAPTWRQAPAAPAAPAEDDYERAYRAGLERVALAGAGVAASSVAAGAYARANDGRGAGVADDFNSPNTDFDATENDAFADSDDAFALDQSYAAESYDEPTRPARNRGLLVAAVVAGVAIVGGIGAFALSYGGGEDGPALVKADTTPVKVKPDTPSGAAEPEMDGKIYETAVGAKPSAPSQEKLISTLEEPIAPVAAAPAADADAPADTNALPGVETPQVKSEERVMPQAVAPQAPQAEDPAVIAPRKVRTMIVKPDGTLVAREDPAPAPVVAEPSAADAAPLVAAAEPTPPAAPAVTAPDNTNYSILPDNAQVKAAPEADVVKPAQKPEAPAAAAAKPAAAPAKPRAEPEPRAAEEPAVAVASAPAAGEGLWSVQIASQPTREGAQASYEDLARRFGGVIGGKGVNIVSAEIANKGTFWRVRIPAASKSDANILCAKLKTAGGSCFVSK